MHSNLPIFILIIFDSFQLAMKRCQYHMNNNPYVEFNFEKSLRKYEPSPRKKVKLDDSTTLKDKNILADRSNGKKETPKKQEDSVQQVDQPKSNDAPPINPTEYKNEPELVQNCNIWDVSAIMHQKNNQTIRVSQKEEQSQDNAAKTQHAHTFAQNQNQQAVNTLQEAKNEIIEAHQQDNHPGIMQISKEAQQQDILFVLQEHLIISQHQIISQQADSEISLGQNLNNHLQTSLVELSKDKMQGGRFNINDHISISRRTLQKYMNKKHRKHQNLSTTDLLEHILKKRSYLASERQQIAKKLEQYLKNL